ncbi:hypothetical protein [uncultured Stenotrophomonas sp.]|uniref:hypothetical protein n=1 Tax=uncultured Stenotrophomonas sp. TaxID=165438 RepID=UPI0028EA5917|nr:hypothetical protein [uncultured Stenotrophomonas sp.]
MPLPSLRSVLSTPLHSPEAIPLAGTLGSVVGAGFELAFRGCTNAAGPAWSVAEVMKPALISGWLGIGCVNAMRWLEPDRAQLQPHERALVDYPGVRQLLHDAGTSVDDIDALKALAGQLEKDFGRMTRQFNDYCRSRGVPPNPLIGGVIRHFFLTHCRERSVMLLSKRTATACYLVAAREGQRHAIADGLNEEGALAGTVLRRMHCPYLRVDLANTALRDAKAFTTDDCNGEMRVHSVHGLPGETLETLEPSELVSVTHRRHTRRRVASGEVAGPMPDLVAHATQAREHVIRSALLRGKLAGVAPDSRTWRELNRIEEDLAANRPCGHLVRVNGVLYHANDIHWEGRQSPGRNAWRLLHRNTPEGHELVDIVDYHRPRT